MKKIQSALISVFHKDGLDNIIRQLSNFGITIYSTGGTQNFIEGLGIACIPVESLTHYPSILGGRVKTLHPSIFGGLLGRRDNENDLAEMREFDIPQIDLVIVDLYPFEQTVKNMADSDIPTADKEKAIIEKIDIGGPSMIRAAAKNFKDVVVIAAKSDYSALEQIFIEQQGATTQEQRKAFASRAFNIVAQYDMAIANYFSPFEPAQFTAMAGNPLPLRYGENPHQDAIFFGDLSQLFIQLNGKALSYNNLVDVEAAMSLIQEFHVEEKVFAIIKHTNVCGISSRETVLESWIAALQGDPESAFGGVLICNNPIDAQTATAINEIFFEVLIAPSFDPAAIIFLEAKKNRIILQSKKTISQTRKFQSLMNGILTQSMDTGNYQDWKESGAQETTIEEKENLAFANVVCKHLKSNAIAIVKHKQLIGKGCGQTSRIDALRQAINKAKQFQLDLKGSVMASDAFFPFDDCVKIAGQEGIVSFIQPGGSIRDADSIAYCKKNGLSMVLTGMRHFRH